MFSKRSLSGKQRRGRPRCASAQAPLRSRPQAARAHQWRPEQSGNPSGRGGLYQECRRLAAEASPEAMRRLIELINAEDERVSYMATTAVLDRSGVKPIDYDPAEDQPQPSWDPGALSDEEREQLKAIYRKMLAGTGRP